MKIAESWHEYMPFHIWAIENGYAESLTIDRINVNGDYEPDNCRWVPMVEQSGNRRNNRKITVDGETKNLADWARDCMLSHTAIIVAEKKGIPTDEYIRAHLKVPKLHTHRKPGEPIPACVKCGDTGGKPYQGRKAPGRSSGARFGIEGQLCMKCYHTLYMRDRKEICG
jgi:hypothetical protein